MDFFLLVLLTGIILIRPEELSPDLTGARLYMWGTFLTVIASIHKLRALLTPDELARRSIAVCVIGIYAALIVSTVLAGARDLGVEYTEEFIKTFLYFFLLIAIIDTPERLRYFLGWLVPLICGLAVVSALHYYGEVEFTLLPDVIIEKRIDKETGEVTEIKRALASGIFSDPNDLSMIMILGMLCCMYHAMSTPAISTRIFWLLPIVPLFLILTFTGSRGGMLACLAGFAALSYSYFGMKVGWPLAIAGGLALLAFAGGRSADIAGGGTARERLNLWGEGLTALFRHPVSIPFGLGPGWYVEEQGLLAHNSFINAYVELGIIGGGFFLIAFLTAILLSDSMAREPNAANWVGVMRPGMLSIVVAYAAGCFSLSRNFVLPTYLVLGLATAYINLAGKPPARHIVSTAWIRWTLPVMVMGLIALKLITQILGKGI